MSILDDVGVDLWLDEGDDLWGTFPSDAMASELGKVQVRVIKSTPYKAPPVETACGRLPRGKECRFTISRNSKTGFATSWLIGDVMSRQIKVKHRGTCRPTKWCSKSCYARVGQQAFNLSVWTQYINTLLADKFETMSISEVERWANKAIPPTIHAYRMDNLRFNAVGDFTPGVAKLFNALSRTNPDIKWWGFTRRADTLRLIEPRDNVHINVSVDPTTPGVMGKSGGGWSLESLWDASNVLRDHGVCDFVYADTKPDGPEREEA